MKCKNCNKYMQEIEHSWEDGLLTLIRKCNYCNWTSKSWYDLDECKANNTSWVNEKGQEK